MALLVLLAAIWGASYMLIRLAIDDLSAPVVVVGRTALAAVVLLVVIRLQGGRASAALGEIRRRPGMAVLLGAVAIAGPFLLITYGEIVVPSGVTAVLIASAPIFVALLAPMLDTDEVLGPLQWTGLAMGISGVALLVGVDLVDTTAEILGALAMVGAALLYAISGYVVKHRYAGVPPIVTSLASVATSAVLVAPVIAIDPPTERPGGVAIMAVVILGVFGTAFAFVIFYRLMGEIGVGRSTLVSYLIPSFALVYGATILDEALTAGAIGGFALVAAGTALAAHRAAPPPATATAASADDTLGD